MQEHLTCPITLQTMVEPVIAPDGHTYERSAIETWIREKGTSPQNPSLVMRVDALVPNRVIQSMIDQQRQEAENMDIKSFLSPAIVSQIKNETKVTLHVNSVDKNQSILHIETPNVKEVCIASHICCVIDISGSMCTEAACKDENGMENRTGLNILDVVKFATNVIAKSLKPTDKLSIVTYSDDAQTVLRPTFMDDRGKERVEEVLKNVQPSGRTNLWAGIKMGCGHAIDLGQKFVSSVFVLTDGIPNIHPPLGYDRSLKRLFDNDAMFGNLSTFGFGYNLESKLLVDIANIGGGTFSFIPDSGFVGTCFINALANARCTFGINPSVRINGSIQEDVTCDGQLIVNSDGKRTSVNLTPLRFGAPMDIMFNNQAIHGAGMEVAFKLADGTEISIPVVHTEAGEDKYSDLFHSTRVNFVANAYNIASVDYHHSMNLDSNALLPPSNAKNKREKSKSIDALCKDMEGQATEAISRRDWFLRWGGKYLFSLVGAHLHQFCNNFKDPGVQVYGEGELFISLQEELNDIFEKIPPPKPAIAISQRYTSYGSQSCAPAARTPSISMGRTFNNRNAVCVHGDTKVTVLDASSCEVPTAVSMLKKGDRVLTEDGSFVAVQCIVETKSDKSFDLIQVGNLFVTPYHPIKTDHGHWEFPINCCGARIAIETVACSVFNLILEKYTRDKAVMMNGRPVITLGHGIKDDPVLRHGYFGSELVVRDIMKLPNAEYLGHVVLDEKDVMRANGNGDIYAIRKDIELLQEDEQDVGTIIGCTPHPNNNRKDHGCHKTPVHLIKNATIIG